MRRGILPFRTLTIMALACMGGASALAAQEVPEGVRLSVTYQTAYRPKLAIRTFTGEGELATVAQGIREIINRDLDYSDRFDIVTVPPSLDSGPVDYAPWRDLGVDLLVTAAVERIGGTNGYYYADRLWRVRGLLDLPFGGAGRRRGRRDQIGRAHV